MANPLLPDIWLHFLIFDYHLMISSCLHKLILINFGHLVLSSYFTPVDVILFESNSYEYVLIIMIYIYGQLALVIYVMDSSSMSQSPKSNTLSSFIFIPTNYWTSFLSNRFPSSLWSSLHKNKVIIFKFIYEIAWICSVFMFLFTY